MFTQSYYNHAILMELVNRLATAVNFSGKEDTSSKKTYELVDTVFNCEDGKLVIDADAIIYGYGAFSCDAVIRAYADIEAEELAVFKVRISCFEHCFKLTCRTKDKRTKESSLFKMEEDISEECQKRICSVIVALMDKVEM